jgi:nucleoside phosphorylase
MAQRWLIVGAMGVETAPLLACLSGSRVLTRRTLVGQLDGQEVAITTCGVGPDAAKKATAASLTAFHADAVISVGTAGALVDTLARGSVHSIGRVFYRGALVDELQPLGGLPATSVCTVAEGVWTSERRNRLAALGAELVEMELAAVLEAARAHSPTLPVHGIKVVSDAAGGEEDAVVRAARPDRIARFKIRALGLATTKLTPAIRAAIKA